MYKFSKLLIKEANTKTLRDAIISLHKRAEQPIEKFGILSFPYLFLSSLLTNDEEREISKLCYSTKLHNILIWANKNLLLEIHNDYYSTTNVKLRIITSQLNKLEQEGVLSRDLQILIHDNMVCNLSEVRDDLLDEDLPFLL